MLSFSSTTNVASENNKRFFFEKSMTRKFLSSPCSAPDCQFREKPVIVNCSILQIFTEHGDISLDMGTWSDAIEKVCHQKAKNWNSFGCGSDSMCIDSLAPIHVEPFHCKSWMRIRTFWKRKKIRWRKKRLLIYCQDADVLSWGRSMERLLVFLLHSPSFFRWRISHRNIILIWILLRRRNTFFVCYT